MHGYAVVHPGYPERRGIEEHGDITAVLYRAMALDADSLVFLDLHLFSNCLSAFVYVEYSLPFGGGFP